jgi:hypothetical protein
MVIPAGRVRRWTESGLQAFRALRPPPLPHVPGHRAFLQYRVRRRVQDRIRPENSFGVTSPWNLAEHLAHVAGPLHVRLTARVEMTLGPAFACALDALCRHMPFGAAGFGAIFAVCDALCADAADWEVET